MVIRVKFDEIKPGTLFRVRATCSFAPNEDCISEHGHIYASDGILELSAGTIVMLVEANWLVNVPNFRDEGQQIVLFKFLSETKEIFLPVAIGTFRVQDPVMQVLNFLELYLENINKSVDSSKELWYSRMQGE